jgi:hypothetical protein
MTLIVREAGPACIRRVADRIIAQVSEAKMNSESYFQGGAELLCGQKAALHVNCDLYLKQSGTRRMPTTSAIAYARNEIKGTIAADQLEDLLPYVSSNNSPDNLDLRLSNGTLLHITWLEASGQVACSPR